MKGHIRMMRIKPVFVAVAVTAALALAGCTASPAPAPQPPPATTAPALPPPAPPVEPAPVEPAAPVEQETYAPTTSETVTSELDLESLCSDATWRESNGDAGDAQCGSDWDGSSGVDEYGNVIPPEGDWNYTEPHTDCTWSDSSTVYCEGPEGSYSYEQEPPTADYSTSGETQREWGCEQGYITEGC